MLSVSVFSDSSAPADIELSLMGEDQWYYTFTERLRPSVADMFGSLRPKIYSVTQLLKQRHAERVARARKYYNMDILPLSAQDQVKRCSTLHFTIQV